MAPLFECHPFLHSVTDVVCSFTNDSATVDESQGSILLGITISREVEIPFNCEVETQPISADGMLTLC